MKIYYINNEYKYETEAVMKLFRPLESFEFIFDEAPADDSDICIIAAEDDLWVRVFFDGKAIEKRCEMNEDRELSLCRLLYKAMSELTGITPEWGCLTGIRPVKKVNALIAEGCSQDEVYERLHEKYYISRRKSDLAYLTAVTQKKALDELEDNSYSLYVGIPFCPTRCSYCSFVSHSIQSGSAKKLVPEYVDMLCRELEDLGRIVQDKPYTCSSVYIGGGTPTSLSAEQLDRIMRTIAKSIDISKIREYNVEAGRADTITEDKLIAIRDNGASRISINPQTMNDSVLAAIGRKHTAAEVVKCYELARRLGFDNINMDTIAGLPTDTPEGFERTIDTLIGLDPENITVHTLTVKRSSTLFGSADELREHYNADNALSEMVSCSFDKLTAAGYAPYYLYRQKNTVGNLENVGYAKAGKEGIYNIYIMEEAQTILACGASASTKLVNHATGKITRCFNYKYPYEYISRYDRMTGYKESVADFLAGRC